MVFPRSISLIYSRRPDLTIHLDALIDEDGDLILDGQDLGQFVEDTFGDWDYEYKLTIRASYKDDLFRHLIAEYINAPLIQKTISRVYRVIGTIDILGFTGWILLLLIKNKFDSEPPYSDAKFKEWIEEKGIPVEFWSWA